MSNQPEPGRRLWRAPSDVPGALEPGVLTIGNFDGVHLGHQHLLRAVADCAHERGLRSRALTFHPHPRHVMTGEDCPELITGYEDRNALVLGAGIDDLLDLDFTREFAQHSPEDFVRRYLVDLLDARVVILGRDTRFGRRNEGGFETMCELGERYGFEVMSVEDLHLDSCGPERVSSSRIRRALHAGHMEQATSMLGRWHSVTDVVCHGFKRGRELGFPTANFSASPSGLVPADGVYAGFFSVLDGDRFLTRTPATISVGTNPTFAEGPPHRVVETYVHGSHDYDLYDRAARVEFVSRLRPTLAFDGVEALVSQMHDDVAVTHSTLASLPDLHGARAC